jgi:hypothetical protein
MNCTIEQGIPFHHYQAVTGENVSMAGDAIAVAGARNFRFLRRRGIRCF